MIPVGYMAKQVSSSPGWLKASQVTDVYSVSGCVSEFFCDDYIDSWKHNGYWLFDSPAVIEEVAREKSISVEGTKLFYYEAYELEFTGKEWRQYFPEESMPNNILPPPHKTPEGFDVVTFSAGNSPECSPLSCNGLAEEIPTNSNCLMMHPRAGERWS